MHNARNNYRELPKLAWHERISEYSLNFHSSLVG